MSYATPYAGLKIVDITQGFAGPYCAGIFALYGADVIKVEPFEGDWIRAIGESYGGQTPLGMVANPHKRSIALNLKSDAARDIVHKLAVDADVSWRASGLAWRCVWASGSTIFKKQI